jgi:rhamnosyltransferase
VHSDANKVCAVIVTHANGECLLSCVNAVVDQVSEVVLISNGSSAKGLALLRELERRPRVAVIYNGSNMGIACAMNQGVRYAIERGHRWVLTLDDDSEATPGMVDKLLEIYRALGDRVGIVAADPFDINTRRFQQAGIDRTACYVFAKSVISSGSLIDTRVFGRVGFFDEAFFMYYVDDDFCLRVSRSGLKIVLCCEALLRHREGAKVTRRFCGREIFYDEQGGEAKYYIARNGIYLALKYPRETHFGYRHLRRVAGDFVKILLYDAHPASKASYVLKGLWDGIRGRYGSLSSPQPTH